MNRAELEAAIWRHMPVTPRSPASRARVEAILEAADEYAAYVGGITAERRAILAEAERTENAARRAARKEAS